jgi:hypothetical protein
MLTEKYEEEEEEEKKQVEEILDAEVEAVLLEVFQKLKSDPKTQSGTRTESDPKTQSGTRTQSLSGFVKMTE